MKVGGGSEIKIKNLFCISLTLHYSTAIAVKVGGGSEIKIKDFILYFSHLLAYLWIR